MKKTVFLVIPVLLLGMGIGISVNAYGDHHGFIPDWIKNIAKFWANDQISDQEFISALQFLVEKDVLIIPGKTPVVQPTQNNPDQTIPSYKPVLESFTTQGQSYIVLVSLSDTNGNFKEMNGDLIISITDNDDKELLHDKKYLSANSFSEFTNKFSNKKVTAFQWVIPKTKFKPSTSTWEYLTLSFTDIKGDIHENKIKFTQFPVTTGFFGEDTGFIKETEINHVLDLGPFYTAITSVGPYSGLENGKVKTFFRVNFDVQNKQVGAVPYTIDQLYITDETGKLYFPTSYSFAELKKTFDDEYSYVLFDELPSDTSQITIIAKLSVIETDYSQKHYEDKANIYLH